VPRDGAREVMGWVENLDRDPFEPVERGHLRKVTQRTGGAAGPRGDAALRLPAGGVSRRTVTGNIVSVAVV
jgi:hypothetical protein